MDEWILQWSSSRRNSIMDFILKTLWPEAAVGAVAVWNEGDADIHYRTLIYKYSWGFNLHICKVKNNGKYGFVDLNGLQATRQLQILLKGSVTSLRMMTSAALMRVLAAVFALVQSGKWLWDVGSFTCLFSLKQCDRSYRIKAFHCVVNRGDSDGASSLGNNCKHTYSYLSNYKHDKKNS